ncbi:MAG: ATP-binding protein [Verrucomicrobiota bacterium]|nr:ATP-binding protein [Verrucomicrobiota bacterium]
MKRKLEFSSHPANLSILRKFVRGFLTELNTPEDDVDLLVLGIDEACTNIIRHAYDDEETHLITVVCEHSGDAVEFRLRDYGAHTHVAEMVGRALETVKPGGLGIHLIRSAFDSVSYCHKSRGTELILQKRIAGGAVAKA